MKLDMESGMTEIIGIASLCVKHGCTSIVPDVYVRVSQYIPWIKRNLGNFETTETTSSFSTAFIITISLSVVAVILILGLIYLFCKKK